MKRIPILLAEKFLDLAYTLLWTPNTPNPFELHEPADYWWAGEDPETLYAVRRAAPQLRFSRPRKLPFATHVRFTYESPFQSAFQENNTVYGLANLRPHGRSKAALIFLHGHAMNTFLLMEWLARPAIELGLDVYYIALPYHMQRAPRGTWGGQYSLSSSIEGTALAFMQGVQDVRALMNWIELVARMPVMLAGISLGAFTACMTAVVDRRPRALVSLIGGGSLAQILWDGYRLGQMRRQLETGGVTLEALEYYWAQMSPQYWRPRIETGRVLVIGGEHDPIVTAENVRNLWNAWEKPPIRWYPAGHTTIGLYHHQMSAEIYRFLQQFV